MVHKFLNDKFSTTVDSNYPWSFGMTLYAKSFRYLSAVFILSFSLGALPVIANAGSSAGSVIPQADWDLMFVDSEELVGENGKAVNAFDGKVDTLWHAEWKNANPNHPHELQIDLGARYDLEGFRYLPRQDGGVNGRIGQYEFYVSTDGSNWGSPVASGTFANDDLEKEVLFSQVTGQFIRLVALSEVNGKPGTSMAELNVLGVPSSISISPPDVVSIDPDTSVNIDVLGSTTGTVSIVDGPANGTVSIQADNTITYTPNSGYVGQDSFIYKITDSKDNTTLSTLTIKVGCTDCLADVNLTLSWDPSLEEVLGYRVYYGTTSGIATQPLSDLNIASSEIDPQAPSVTYNVGTDLGLHAGDLVCFQVNAYNNSGESNVSETMCAEI